MYKNVFPLLTDATLNAANITDAHNMVEISPHSVGCYCAENAPLKIG